MNVGKVNYLNGWTRLRVGSYFLVQLVYEIIICKV